MADAILSAGRTEPAPVDPKAERRRALAEVRRVIKSPTSTDDELEDALEALVELAKE